MSIFKKLLTAGEGKKLKALEAVVPVVNAHEEAIDGAWRTTSCGARPTSSGYRLDNGEELDDLMGEAFAVARERLRREPSVNVTSTSSSWAVPRSTMAGSPR